MDIGANSQPLAIFEAWMKEAKQNPQIHEASAMTVATMNASGAIHARVVLCKQWSEEGFVFFTNYNSRKGLDLQHNANVAAVFYWDPVFRQIKISGKAHKTSRKVSEDYWNSRPVGSQLSQYISRQSEAVTSREVLEQARREAEKKFAGKAVPCPAHWGGYVIVPQTIEFWMGQPNRLHDRYEFEKSHKSWTFRRLYP